VRLRRRPKDYYPGLTSDQKKALARISYAKFLTDVAGVHGASSVLSGLAARPFSAWGLMQLQPRMWG
jgi:hypothetical protein